MTQTPDLDSTRVDFDTILNNIPSINMAHAQPMHHLLKAMIKVLMYR